ncbi:putative metal-binding motif-containing protein [Flagellimonas iocasae]|uniref:Metal-binding motif-containing protein n=1 Tax=Flagellimonas iocasae TaxID=2055905 RepID=A0ABW4XW62_9FLAO
MKNSNLLLFLFLTSFCLVVSCSKDDPCKESTFYKDADGDGFGDPANSKNACTQPTGYVADKTDTDDTDASIFPGCTAVAFYRDADGDGFGDPANSQNACAAPDGFVDDKTDPNDADATITPNSCAEITFYEDADGDTYGDPLVSISACIQPDGYVANNTDPDDSDPKIFPGCTEETWYRDEDGDGYGDPNAFTITCNPGDDKYVLDNTDCDDTNPALNPGAEEVAGDNIDNNCDGIQGIIWTGADLTFTKAANADWTLPENQDQITENVVFTRQNTGLMYNYQWWQDTFGEDAYHFEGEASDLEADFWNQSDLTSDSKDFEAIMASGGTKGVRWALLDDTGAQNPGPTWDDFPLYGTLGDPTHFYSFHNIITIISLIDNGFNEGAIPVTEVHDNFSVLAEGGEDFDEFNFQSIIGQKLGVWLVEEDIYFTLTFTEWGEGQNGGGSFSYTRSTPN